MSQKLLKELLQKWGRLRNHYEQLGLVEALEENLQCTTDIEELLALNNIEINLGQTE